MSAPAPNIPYVNLAAQHAALEAELVAAARAVIRGGQFILGREVEESERRAELQRFLLERGIGTAVHYPTPIHLQPVAADLGYKHGAFPVAEAQAERILSLPIYPELAGEQIDAVVVAIREFYGAARS